MSAGSDSAGAVLTVSDLAVRRGRREVLNRVDLAVAAGEVVAVLGPNGAGKSTLLAALQGSLPAASGTVTRHGRAATVLQSPGLARRSAVANVELALQWWGAPRRQRRRRALDALRDMRAEHLARRQATTLSGGEQRRVHLARAVAVRPDILLLDEPFDGLDPETHATLRDDATEAFRSTGAATVVVLHDRADAFAMADRLVVLLEGRVAAIGPPQDVLNRPPTAAVAAFLGYDGELVTARGRLLTRPRHVELRSSGEGGGTFTGTVTRAVRVEDGALVHVACTEGAVWARNAVLIEPGTVVSFAVSGAVEYDDQH